MSQLPQQNQTKDQLSVMMVGTARAKVQKQRQKRPPYGRIWWVRQKQERLF